MPQHLEARETPQQGSALGAKIFELLAVLARWIGPEGIERRPQRAPFQRGHRGIIDDIARPQPGDRILARGQNIRLKFRKFLNIDIKRVQKQSAVGRIGAAIGRTVIE